MPPARPATRLPPIYGRLGKLARRLAAAVLVGQALAVFFAALVARALVALDVGQPEWQMWTGIGIAGACLLATGLLRAPFGVTLGWVLQVLTLAFAFVVPLMLVVGLAFLAMWVTALVVGGRLDAHTARVDEAYYASHPDQRP